MFYSGFADEAATDIETQIKAHKEIGEFDAIEPRMVDGVQFTKLSDGEFDRVYGLLQSAGISISCYGSAIANWARDIDGDFSEDVDDLKRCVPRMKRTGTPFIRVMSYPNAGWPEAEWRGEVIRRMRRLAKMAEDGGVILAHENCSGWGGLGPQQSLELLKEVDSPAFQLLYDTGNPTGHAQDGWDYYSRTIDHTVYVHIKDCKSVAGDVQYTYCGDGDGCVPEILADLHKRGYDGFVSIEPHLAAIVHEPKEADDAAVAFEKYLNYGRRLMAESEKAAKLQ